MKSLAVDRWPGPVPTPTDGLFAILIDTGATAPPALPAAKHRDAARRLIRQATREALAAVLGMPAEDIAIVSTPGTPPQILLAGRATTVGISFSHDGPYALAAVNLRGRIGADIMQLQDIPGWHTVAHDYLGPATAAAVQARPPEERPRAFTSAWTQREAALKCHAQQLSEWQADLAGVTIPLILPVPKLTGHIHIGDNDA